MPQFTPGAARKIRETVLREQHRYRGGGVPDRGAAAKVWNPGTVLAKSGGSGIPALSGSNPGSGTVTFYTFDGTTLTATSDTATAFNLGTVAVGNNKFLAVAWVNGYWFVTVESC